MKIPRIVLLSLLFLLFTLNAKSQENPLINQGHKMIGGSVTCQYSMTNKFFYIGGFPSYNYFIFNNLAIGFNAGYGYYYHKSTTSSNVEYRYTSDNFKIVPNIRFYLIRHLFIEANGGINWTKGEYHFFTKNSSQGPYDYTDDITKFNYNLNIGYSFFVKDNVALDLIMNYYHNSSSFHVSTAGIDSQNGKDEGMQILLGFQVFID